MGVHVLEELQQLLIRPLRQDAADPIVGRRQGSQEEGDRHRAATVEAEDDQIVPARLELQPHPAVRDQLGHGQRAAQGGVLLHIEVDPRGADQLGDHHPLGAVVNERPVAGHPRDLPEEHVLHHGLPPGHDQGHLDPHPAAVGEVPLQALQLAVFRLVEPVAQLELAGHRVVAREIQAHLAVEALDGRDLIEELLEALLDEPLERAVLDLDEVRRLQDLRDMRVALLAACPDHQDHSLLQVSPGFGGRVEVRRAPGRSA
jgi:hypothetical protein